MTNHYEGPDVIEVGSASDLILGTDKTFPFFPDSPGQARRTQQMSEDE